jgi:hypothetical protein
MLTAAPPPLNKGHDTQPNHLPHTILQYRKSVTPADQSVSLQVKAMDAAVQCCRYILSKSQPHQGPKIHPARLLGRI